MTELNDVHTGHLFRVSVNVVGIKKRCRKTERHCFQLGYIPYNEGNFDKDAILDKAKAFLAENMKEVKGVPRVNLSVTERKKDAYGVTETFQMFDERNKSFDLQTSLQQELN